MREQLGVHLMANQGQPTTTVVYILVNNENTLSTALALGCDSCPKEFAGQSTKQLRKTTLEDSAKMNKEKWVFFLF